MQKTATEVVIDDMVMLDTKKSDSHEEAAKQPDTQPVVTAS
jgi:hypothetical protein